MHERGRCYSLYKHLSITNAVSTAENKPACRTIQSIFKRLICAVRRSKENLSGHSRRRQCLRPFRSCDLDTGARYAHCRSPPGQAYAVTSAGRLRSDQNVRVYWIALLKVCKCCRFFRRVPLYTFESAKLHGIVLVVTRRHTSVVNFPRKFGQISVLAHGAAE